MCIHTFHGQIHMYKTHTHTCTHIHTHTCVCIYKCAACTRKIRKSAQICKHRCTQRRIRVTRTQIPVEPRKLWLTATFMGHPVRNLRDTVTKYCIMYRHKNDFKHTHKHACIHLHKHAYDKYIQIRFICIWHRTLSNF